jgi:hypothetical protein
MLYSLISQWLFLHVFYELTWTYKKTNNKTSNKQQQQQNKQQTNNNNKTSNKQLTKKKTHTHIPEYTQTHNHNNKYALIDIIYNQKYNNIK